MRRVELSRKAQRDLCPLRRQPIWALIERALTHELTVEPPPENLDIKPLVGATPWLRLRVGVYRIIYRPMPSEELVALGSDATLGYLVERVIHRRDLMDAVRSL